MVLVWISNFGLMFAEIHTMREQVSCYPDITIQNIFFFFLHKERRLRRQIFIQLKDSVQHELQFPEY